MSKKSIDVGSNKVPVKERALIARMNRLLKEEDRRVFTLTGKAADEFGRYIVVPIPSFADVVGWGRRGPVTSSRIDTGTNDLEELARELGALAEGEELRDDGWEVRQE